jgi:hypothetical protein
MVLDLFEARQGLARSQAIDPTWRDVQAQEPVFGGFMQAAQRIVANLSVESAQGCARCARVSEQRAYGLQATVSLTQTAQGLDAGDAARGSVDKRLEAGERLPVDHGASLEWLAKKGPTLEMRAGPFLLARMQPARLNFYAKSPAWPV